MALQHLRSSTANKRPLPTSMADGQLALNGNIASPGLFFKNSTGGLVKVGPVHVGTTAPNATPATGGQSGNSVGEQWLDTTGGTYVFKVWDGTAWRSETGTFVDVNGDTMTGALGIIAGTAAAPGLFISGDTNTGIYSPGADQVAISTGGTGRLFVDSSGRLLVGTSSARTNFYNTTYSSQFQVEGNSSTTGQISLTSTFNGVNGPNLIFGKHRSGSVGGNTVVQNNDQLGVLAFMGSDGSEQVAGAYIQALVDGTPGANDMPGRLVFSTTADGASSPTERMRIDSSGNVGIGTTSPGSILDCRGSGPTIQATATDQTNARVRIQAGNAQSSYLEFGDSDDDDVGEIVYDHSNNSMRFNTAATERARIDSSGRLLVGRSTWSDPAIAVFEAYSGGASGQSIVYFARGNSATSLPVNAALSQLKFSDNAGAEFARIEANVDGTTGASDYPGRLVFSTTADGSSSPTERLRIDSSGNLNLVSSSSTLTNLNFTENLLNTYARIEGGKSGSGVGDLRFHTYSGGLSERLRIDSSGRLLVGTSTDVGSQLLQVIGGSNAAAEVVIGNSVASTGQTSTITLAPANKLAGAQIICTAEEDFSTSANRTARLTFSTRLDGSLEERMRISSAGSLYVGTGGGNAPNGTSVGGSAFIDESDNRKTLFLATTTSTAGLVRFHNTNGQVGTIVVSGSATSYNTSSDYRLKENVVPLTGASARINQLQVHRFNFIADPDTTVDGFLAHEAQAVVPECVTGTKDEVDADGNPVYQGIDQSKLVPLLTAALQEALAEIESLKARVTALEP